MATRLPASDPRRISSSFSLSRSVTYLFVRSFSRSVNSSIYSWFFAFSFPTSYATRSVHLRRISPRPIRIRPLHTSLCFHAGPIDLVFFKGSYLLRAGHVISRGASRLDAFSAYPFPTWLPSAAPGGTTGTPAVGSSRSSRTKDDSSHISYARGR